MCCGNHFFGINLVAYQAASVNRFYSNAAQAYTSEGMNSSSELTYSNSHSHYASENLQFEGASIAYASSAPAASYRPQEIYIAPSLPIEIINQGPAPRYYLSGPATIERAIGMPVNRPSGIPAVPYQGISQEVKQMTQMYQKQHELLDLIFQAQEEQRHTHPHTHMNNKKLVLSHE